MSELSKLLTEHLPKGWSRRQVAREARKRGHVLSDASATAYFAGRHGMPDDATIAAFAEVLRIPETQIRAAAGVAPVGEPWVPPQSSRYLRSDQRAALEQLISTMVERTEGGEGDAGSSPENRPPGSGPDQQSSAGLSVLPTAASKTPREPSVNRRRRKQDEAGEASQDDGSMEPS